MLSPIMLSSSTSSTRIGLHLFSRTMSTLLPARQPPACHTKVHYVELILSHPRDTQGRHRRPCLRRGLAHRRLPPRTAYGEESPRGSSRPATGTTWWNLSAHRLPQLIPDEVLHGPRWGSPITPVDA